MSASRGALWLRALTQEQAVLSGYPSSVQVVDAHLGDRQARYISVVPDTENRFPRARAGEVGLIEGWALARAVRELMQREQHQLEKSAVVAIIDVASQAYGRREEAYGIHLALAAAAAAYAEARLAGHPVIGLIVGKAMSGAFLAHGYQANRLIAIDDADVMVHAMGKQSAARITMRSVEALEAFAQSIPPMAYDIRSYAGLGLLWDSVSLAQPDAPTDSDLGIVQSKLQAALEDILRSARQDLAGRLCGQHRQATRTVREALQAQWQAE
jgi:malonate decarboxylase gamma subunit